MKPYAQSRIQGVAEMHAPRIKRLAQQMASRMPANVSEEDLFQEGMIGLLDAMQRYEPQPGVSFEAYGLTRARGAMMDACRRLDILPRHQRDKADEVQKSIQRLTQTLGRAPTASEIAQEMQMPLADFHSMREGFLEFTAFEDLIESEGVVDENADPLQSASMREFIQKVAALVPTLAHNLQLVLALHYQEEMSYSEMAQILKLSRGRISQLHTEAIEKLRTLMLEARESRSPTGLSPGSAVEVPTAKPTAHPGRSGIGC